MGGLDTAQKIWTFVAAGVALISFIAYAAWEVRGVFARFELQEQMMVEMREHDAYLEDLSRRLMKNHEEDHHGQ